LHHVGVYLCMHLTRNNNISRNTLMFTFGFKT
jgi:hypothetical protein